jgi:hypothetical protein
MYGYGPMLEDGIQARSIHHAHPAVKDWDHLAQFGTLFWLQMFNVRERGEWGILGQRASSSKVDIRQGSFVNVSMEGNWSHSHMTERSISSLGSIFNG